jgi:hypothetical protein
MARTTKLAPTEKSAPNTKQVIAPSRFGAIRNNLPTILGAVALVAAGALAGSALAHGGPEGRDGRHPGPGLEARMEMEGGRHGDHHRGPNGPRAEADFTGSVTSVSSTELSITLADGTTTTVALDSSSQYFAKSAGTAADVTVGSYVLVQAARPEGTTAIEAVGIAVLENGLTDAHVHLGRPAKVTAVDGNTLTVEMATRDGVKSLTVTIGATTAISKIATATNTDITIGDSVVVDLGRESTAAKSVLIVK